MKRFVLAAIFTLALTVYGQEKPETKAAPKKLTTEQKLALREAQLAATSAALQLSTANTQFEKILAATESQAGCKVDPQTAECVSEKPKP